jgi:hypothetical protein
MAINKFKPQQKYKEKQTREGMTQVTVWVPVDARHLVVKHAETLRNKAKK